MKVGGSEHLAPLFLHGQFSDMLTLSARSLINQLTELCTGVGVHTRAWRLLVCVTEERGMTRGWRGAVLLFLHVIIFSFFSKEQHFKNQ